jgi:mannose-6-phosphate isomerase-like protein (cupin superfamily)
MPNYLIAQMNELDAVPCPCGQSRRAFVDDPARTASMHLLDVKGDAHVHYHKTLTEIYFILEGEGHLELDGEMVPVKPMTAVLIKPGCRHRAIGTLRIIIVPIPAFDPGDEWTD